MSQNKYLVDVLEQSGTPFTAWNSTRRVKDKYLYSPDSEKYKKITVKFPCDDDTYAFALCISLYAKFSCLTEDILFSQVEQARKMSVKTGFGDKISVVYNNRWHRMHFKANGRQSALKILLFLFRELRAIKCLDLTIREDIKDSTFILLLNDAECFKTYYKPEDDDFGTEKILRQIVDNVLGGDAPIDSNEILAEKQGAALYDVFRTFTLPKVFSSLDDIDIEEFSPRRHIYVSQLTSKPKREIEESTHETQAKKKVKNKHSSSQVSQGANPQMLSDKAKRKAQFKAIKTKKGSLPSFWDRVEMRGDHDD